MLRVGSGDETTESPSGARVHSVTPLYHICWLMKQKRFIVLDLPVCVFFIWMSIASFGCGSLFSIIISRESFPLCPACMHWGYKLQMFWETLA